MSIPRWVDNSGYSKIGTVGYLVQVDNTSDGGTRYSIRERPLRTNRSAVAKLHGWCGETDNRSYTACGVVRIVGTNREGDRARIAAVTGAELSEFLESDGYPELIPSDSEMPLPKVVLTHCPAHATMRLMGDGASYACGCQVTS